VSDDVGDVADNEDNPETGTGASTTVVSVRKKNSFKNRKQMQRPVRKDSTKEAAIKDTTKESNKEEDDKVCF